MVNLADVENGLPYSEDELDKPIKDITLGNAVKIRPMHFDYNRGTLARFGAGVVRGFESLEDIPEQVELFGDEISYGLGGYFGDDEKEINRKRSNIDTAIRNLEEIQKKRDRYSSPVEQESLAFGVGEGVPSYATALAGGYIGGSLAKLAGATAKGITAASTAGGLASMAPQQFGSEVQQRLPRTETGEIDYEKITPKWALKVNGGALVATAVNLVLEKKLGFGEQMKVWRTPIKFGKFTPTNVARGLTKGGVSAASEGTTEALQDLSSYGISLVDGTATIEDFPEQMQQALKSGIIGGILGGTVGTAVAIREGYNFKKQLRDMVAPVVQNVETAEKIADEVYNSANDTMTNIISKELELDSQLKAKRGDVYNSMVRAVSKAIDKSGGYTGLTEEQKAQHATEVANMFADQALAEANKRGILITDVVDAKDIVYQDGGIRFAPKTTVKKSRQYHPERMNLLTYLKYKGGLKDVGGDLKSMDAGKQVIGLINNKYGRSLDDAALDAWENGYFSGQERPTVNQLLDAIDRSLRGQKIYRESFRPIVEKKQEKLKEAEDLYRLDQYLSDFFSQEELDSMSLEDKSRFYNDIQDQANATTEDDYLQQEIDSLNETEAERYSIMLENGSTHDEAMERIRAMRQSPELDEFFDILQTRETEKGVELYQSAFAGSRVDYDRPSLEAIGSGEGNQAHGWGLYYALNKDVAERYRENFTRGARNLEYDGKEIKYMRLSEKKKAPALKRVIHDFVYNSFDDISDMIPEKLQKMKDYYEREVRNSSVINDKERGRLAAENLEALKDFDISKLKEKKQGQVHEVDIPENPYLLDEQKSYKEQSDFVREALQKAVMDLENPNFKEKIFDNREEAIDFYDSKIDEFEEKADGYQRFMPQSFLTNDGKFGVKYVDDYTVYEPIIGENTDITGEGIYSKIAHRLGSQKEASQYLEKYGIKGITYYGRQDGRCFVIFNSNDVKVIQKFYQGGKVKRGSYNEDSKVIKLFKDANTSTLPHELAHYWLDNMYSYVKSGAASVDYLNQFQAVKDFLGIKDNQEFLTRQQQEKFASGYEKYIHRGIIPNSIMGNVYAGYERWLRDVYDSIEDIKAQGKLPFKLTPEIIKFFDSMLTGGLGEVATTEVADIARLEETQEADNEVTKEAKEVIDAKPIKQTTELLPVKSEGEVKESRLYERMKDLGDAEDSLGYNEVTIAEQREKAQKMWQENPEQAQSILNDVNFSNDILRNALFTEQQARALESGDTDTYLSSLRQQSAEATRMGQELSALRGVLEDITMPAYWIREAEMEAHKQLAKKMTSYIDNLRGKSSLESLTRQLDEDIDSLTQKMLSSDDKVKTLKEGINDLKKKYKGLEQRDVELFQEEFTNEAEARKYVEKKAKEAIGLNLTDEQANNIIQMASNLDKMSDKFDKFGVPSEKYFAEKAKLEKAVNEHTPTSQVKVLISTIGRANMLTAPATSVLNVVSNLENYAIQKSLRYINNNITNHTNDNIVDSELAKEYRAKLWQTFWNTGYDVSIMRSLTDTKLYKGESITHSEGDGAIRQIGRFAEKYVFSRLISSPDIYFKSIKGFTDYVGNEATDIAYKEGLTGEKAKNRANDLFLDATRIEPQTEEGKLIRQKAQIEAAVITYQQDTELSKNLLKLRELINKGTGDIGIGDILSPFVKTPANILSMGYDATVGAFGHPKNLIQAINDLRSGNLQSDALQTTIRQTTNQVLSGVLIAVILSALIDDDDYIPDYSQLSQSERNAVREAGGTFGSVKIGDTYISTDFFGPLEMPLVAWLNARREKGLLGKASAFGGAVIREFLDAPVIRDTISSSKSLENIGAGHLELEEALYDYLGDTISSRLTPNVLNILAKITDDYERKAGKSIIDKLKARIPYLRQDLPTQVSMATGRPVETQDAWLQILFGARAKEERNSPLAKEFRRLSQTGNGASISDPTKYGDLRTLPDELKIKVLKDFSEQYAKEANKTINLVSYKKAGNEEKKNMLDKVRRKTTKDIKQKYKKYLKKNKQ